MNINQLIKRIKDDIGLSRYYKTSFTDKDLYDIIVNHVVKEFSWYFKVEVELGTVNLDRSVGPDIVLIPQYVLDKLEACDLRLEDIKTIRFQSNQMMDRTGLGQVAAFNMDYLSLASAYAGIADMRRLGGSDMFENYLKTCWFEKPNRIRFEWNQAYEIPSICTMSILVNMRENLIGLPIGREHTFYELAKYTIMSIIYQNESKYIDNIQSGLGNISLKVDEWQNADEKKKELTDKMYNDSILDQVVIKVI